MGETITTRFESGPEQEIARDITKRAMYIAPPMLLISGLIWQLNGMWSCLYGLTLVIINFIFAAALLHWAARISVSFIMAAALFGYLVRLSLIFLAVMLVRNASWVSLIPLGVTIIVSHIGLLVWELRYVSASLAFPGLKPQTVSKES